MRFTGSLFVSALFACSASVCAAASAWGFEDATISIQGKKAGVGGGLKEKWVLPTPDGSMPPMLT